MTYISYNRMSRDVIALAAKLPRFDLICGVPRSGMLVASKLALLQDTALGCIDPERGIVTMKGGYREPVRGGRADVLIIDDSIHSGRAMSEVKKKLDGVPGLNFAALYATPGMEGEVDYFGQFLPPQRAFAWNLFNATVLASACLDIDGVICRDPDPMEADWDRFFTTTKALFPIQYPVHSFVTGRVEGRRKQTQDWLWNHGISYHHLRMRPDQSMDNAEFKAAEYAKTTCSLFIESDPVQAATIAKLTNRPVVCTADFELYGDTK